jgi:aryl-alcohol dehydrogenase-like predicted oxidoreductase
VRELGVGFVAYSPLGRGFLTGRFQRPEDVPDGDSRRNHPRFQGENFERNLALVDRVREIAAAKRVEPAQLALAWVLHRGDDVVPIPGTTTRRHLEQNLAAAAIELDEQDLARLDQAAPKGITAGDRYPDMSPIER